VKKLLVLFFSSILLIGVIVPQKSNVKAATIPPHCIPDYPCPTDPPPTELDPEAPIETQPDMSNFDIKTVTDDSQVRIVKVTDKTTGEVFESTYTKGVDEVTTTTEIEGVKTVVYSSSADIKDSLDKSEMLAESEARRLVTSGQTYGGKLKYYYYSDKYWVLKNNGKSKTVKETTSNRTNILRFRDAVDDVLSAQLGLAAYTGASVTSIVVTVGTAAKNWATVLGTLAAIGFSFSAIPYAWNVFRYTGTAKFYYARI
jgi:hypothetical protein